MINEDKLDKVLSEIGKLSEQMLLMQAVLLELTRPSSSSRRSIRTMSVVLDGCEDQSVEPSDDADDQGDDQSDDGDGGEKAARKPGIVRAKPSKYTEPSGKRKKE